MIDLRSSMLLASTALMAAPAAVQADEPPATQRVVVEPVDQRVEDRSPLSASLRQVDSGLRQPADFMSLFRLPDGRLARGQGGLYAIFPESTYTPLGLPQVPPGTSFLIGEPDLGRPAAGSPSAGRLDLRLRRRIDADAPDAPGAPPTAGQHGAGDPSPQSRLGPAGPVTEPRIVADQAYRARRMRDLLRRAADARRGEAR